MDTLDCGHLPTPSPIGTGYGTFNEMTYCYDCCAEVEKLAMMEHGKAFLYLDRVNWKIVDWPGNEIARIKNLLEGKHNIARKVINVWFDFDGYEWWGRNWPSAGDYVRCQKTTRKVT